MAPPGQPLEAAVVAVSLPHLHLLTRDMSPQQVHELCHEAWEFSRGEVDQASGLGPLVEGERALWIAPTVQVGLELAFGISRSLSHTLHQRGHHQPVGAALGHGALWISSSGAVHGAEALRVRTLSAVWLGSEIACTLAARERLDPPPGLGLARAPRALEERCGQAFHLVSDYR